MKTLWIREARPCVGPSRWTVELGLEKRDAWVGVCWDRRHEVAFADVAGVDRPGWRAFRRLDVYVCLLPFVVVHVRRLGDPLPGVVPPAT